jgi:hypothetical protein
MASQLTLVNNVLRRLREDTVTSVADNAYAQLIAIFINDGIREVCEAYDWNALFHTIDVDLVDGTSEYDLSATVALGGNVDNAGRATTMDSMLRFDMYGRPLAFIYDSAADTEANIQLRLITEDERQRRYLEDTGEVNTEPSMFSLLQATDGDGYIIRIWPEPDAARRLKIVFSTPQAELAIDGTDDSTDIIVPNQVVEAYAHLTAANERGEEIGEPGNMLERRYQRLLGGAIEAAMSADQRTNRYESWRD